MSTKAREDIYVVSRTLIDYQKYNFNDHFSGISTNDLLKFTQLITHSKVVITTNKW
jgi:hypothetical protein